MSIPHRVSFDAFQSYPVAAGLPASQPASAGLCGVPGNPVPSRPRLRLVPSHGAMLRTVTWLPAAPARGTVLLLQGRGDFVEKYFEVAEDLLARGFAVLTFDWRGQGGSQRLLPDPWKGHVDAFADYIGDLTTVAETVLRSLPRPWIGLAHSMGAAILLRTLASDDTWLDSAVLTAPMVALSPALEPAGARLLTFALHGMGFATSPIPGPSRRSQVSPSFDPDNLLTSDPIRYLRSYDVLAAAPHLGVGKPTIGWLQAAYEGMQSLGPRGDVSGVTVPLLVVAGDRDRVTDSRAALALAQRLPAGTPLLLAGAAHDVLMERDALRIRFWDAFDRFSARPPVIAARGRH